MKYIVSYELKDPSRNYQGLIEEIKNSPGWAMITESSFIVDTQETAVSLRNRLNGKIDSNDIVYVCRLDREAAWYGLSEDVSNWIKNNL